MPRKCATDGTHVSVHPRTGAPPRARVGSLVEVQLIKGRPEMGVVLAVVDEGGNWGNQKLDILFNDGERFIVSSNTMRVINRRRRKGKKHGR